MPQQHNPGRHVQSLTLAQSRHNHRNTSAYIFPTVPTPRTTPPTPGTASSRRRAPTLQLPVATRPLHSRHSPAAAQRFHRSDASEHPADTGPRLAAGLQRSNSPTQRSPPIQGIPLPPHNGSTVPTPRTIPPTPEPATRRALPHLTAGPQCSNSPSQLARLIQGTPLPPHNGSTVPTPRTIPPTPEPAPRRAQKNPALRAGPIHLSVIFQ